MDCRPMNHPWLQGIPHVALIITTIAMMNTAFGQSVELPLLSCRIEPHVTVDVGTAVEGIISDIKVSKNERVEVGQVLATIESSVEDITTQLRKLQAEIDSDVDAKQMTYDFRHRYLTRLLDLYIKNVVSFQEVDQAKTEAAVAAKELQRAKDNKQQAELEYRRAQKNLNRSTISSPVRGLIMERYKEPGEHVENEPILQVAQLDPLRVQVYAPVSMFGLISLDMEAIIMTELPKQKGTYRGKVVMVDQVLDAPSNTFGIRLELPNVNYHLPSGLKCKVKFNTVELTLGNRP